MAGLERARLERVHARVCTRQHRAGEGRDCWLKRVHVRVCARWCRAGEMVKTAGLRGCMQGQARDAGV